MIEVNHKAPQSRIKALMWGNYRDSLIWPCSVEEDNVEFIKHEVKIVENPRIFVL